MRRSIFLVLGLGACSQWPRYDHLMVDTASRLPGGTPTVTEWPVTWSSFEAADEPGDDDPRVLSPEVLRTDEGAASIATLSGTGWDYLNPADRVEDCEHVSAFPPDEQGQYLGDVDWRLVDVGEVGVLCSVFVADSPGSQVDVVPFRVDACGLPYEVVLETEGENKGRPVGFGLPGQESRWSLPIDASVRFAIAASGWAPDDASNVVGYHWGLSFLSADALDQGVDACPTPPGAAPVEGE